MVPTHRDQHVCPATGTRCSHRGRRIQTGRQGSSAAAQPAREVSVLLCALEWVSGGHTSVDGDDLPCEVRGAL